LDIYTEEALNQKGKKYMEIIYTKQIELDRNYMFLAIGRDWQGKYCMFENQHNYLSSFSLWLQRKPEMILRDDNHDLTHHNLEDSMRHLENRWLETNDQRVKDLFKDALVCLNKEFVIQQSLISKNK
jgi:hypothetical protein